MLDSMNPQWRNQSPVFGAILFFFILLFLYTKFLGPISFSVNSVQTNKSNVFQATGTGKVTATPNTAMLSFGVTKQSATVEDAQNQVNTATKKVLDAIKNFGVDTKDITTTNYSVQPNYDFSTGKQNVTGYTVTQNIEVKLSPLDKANKVVDLVTSNGANVVGGLTFTIDDETMNKLQDEARKKAVADARKKAESLANAAGMKLGKIIDVQENTGGNPLPMLRGGGPALDVAVKSAPTELPVGESEISSTITLSYETN